MGESGANDSVLSYLAEQLSNLAPQDNHETLVQLLAPLVVELRAGILSWRPAFRDTRNGAMYTFFAMNLLPCFLFNMNTSGPRLIAGAEGD